MHDNETHDIELLHPDDDWLPDEPVETPKKSSRAAEDVSVPVSRDSHPDDWLDLPDERGPCSNNPSGESSAPAPRVDPVTNLEEPPQTLVEPKGEAPFNLSGGSNEVKDDDDLDDLSLAVGGGVQNRPETDGSPTPSASPQVEQDLSHATVGATQHSEAGVLDPLDEAFGEFEGFTEVEEWIPADQDTDLFDAVRGAYLDARSGGAVTEHHVILRVADILRVSPRESAELVGELLSIDPTLSLDDNPEDLEEFNFDSLEDVDDGQSDDSTEELKDFFPAAIDGRPANSDDWLFDYDEMDLGPDSQQRTAPDATADLLAELLDERRFRFDPITEEPDWRISRRAVELAHRLPVFRRDDLERGVEQLRALLTEFPHGASHAAIASLVDIGVTLERLEEAAELKRIWYADSGLWMHRRYDKMQRCWRVLTKGRSGGSAMTWRLANYLLDQDALETVKDNLIGDWRSEWLGVERSDFNGREELFSAFYDYPSYIALRRTALAIPHPDRWHHEHPADRKNFWREMACDEYGARPLDPPTAAMWIDRSLQPTRRIL